MFTCAQMRTLIVALCMGTLTPNANAAVSEKTFRDVIQSVASDYILSAQTRGVRFDVRTRFSRDFPAAGARRPDEKWWVVEFWGGYAKGRRTSKHFFSRVGAGLAARFFDCGLKSSSTFV